MCKNTITKVKKASVEMAMEKLFAKGFCKEGINAIRKETGYSLRNRKATAYRLVVSVIAAYFDGVVGSFAGIQAYFMASFGKICRRAFQLRFKQQEAAMFFAELFAQITSSIITQFAQSSNGLLKIYREVVAIDGTKIYMPPRAQANFPANTKGKAGMRLLVSYFLSLGYINDCFIGAQSDHDLTLFKLLDLKMPTKSLLIGDLGFFGTYIIDWVQKRSCDVLLRLKSNTTPKIEAVFLGKGGKRAKGKKLYDWLGHKYRGEYLDIDVVWQQRQLRLVGFWIKRPKGNSHYRLYLTTASRNKINAETLVQAYRVRWNIELLFKEEKQTAGLGKCHTADEHASMALFYGALCGHVLLKYFRIMLSVLCDIQLCKLRPREIRRKIKARLTTLITALLLGANAMVDFLFSLMDECVLAAKDAIPSKSKPLIPESLGLVGP